MGFFLQNLPAWLKALDDLAYVIECTANDYTGELKRELSTLIDRIKSKESGYDLPVIQEALPQLEKALECYQGYKKELSKTNILTGVSRDWWNKLLRGHIDPEPTAQPKEKITTLATDIAAVCFGMVDRYLADRGFGFVKNELPGKLGESYFFHIKTLKKARPDLAVRLESGVNVGFWYCLRDSQNGKKEALPLTVAQLDANKTPSSPLIKQVETLWSGNDAPPLWLADVTRDLLGAERATELTRQREVAEAERKRLEIGRLELEKSEYAARLAKEEAEFSALVAEIKPLGFRESRQVSDYIVRNNLGYKYKKISGYVTMENLTRTWEFKGGFPPNIYARLCDELGLENQHSGAGATDFRSFEDSQIE